jgi:hypothetical protein
MVDKGARSSLFGEHPGAAELVMLSGRGLHSSTCQLNVSAFRGTRGI